MTLLTQIGFVFICFIIFFLLPYIINQTLKEFKFFGLNRNPILNIIFRSFAILNYLVLMAVFFFFNLKIFT